MPSCLFYLFSVSVSWWSPSRGPILIFLCFICTEREMAGQDSVDEMEQMMLQMEQMKDMIREWETGGKFL